MKHTIVSFKSQGKQISFKAKAPRKGSRARISKSKMHPSLKMQAQAVLAGDVRRDSKGRFLK